MKRDLVLTCDLAGALQRFAVWRGDEVLDLYYENPQAPDLSGAIVAAKLVRAAAGGKAGWFDAGLAQKLYVEGVLGLSTGAVVTLRIKTTLGQGKAWPASLCAKAVPDGAALGLLTPPLPLWQRLLAGDQAARFDAIHFADSAAERTFKAVAAHENPAWLDLLKKENMSLWTSGLDEVEEELAAPRVELSQGASLVIEPTEALVAIDVNGGESANALGVNILAARAIARQIRLRNLGGIIVIDALKMKARTDGIKFLKALSDSVATDPAGVQVFGLTKLGLVEMTRQRIGPAFHERSGA